MDFCPLFRISGSIIKPSRETLLDYCSYCLIVIALIGTARIWIGGSGLTEDCQVRQYVIDGKIPDINQTSKDTVTISDLESVNATIVASGIAEYEELPTKCAKYYQSVFAYVLLVESTILLFSGLIWTKLPKVSQSIDRFSEVVKSCGKSNWAKKALNVISERRQAGDVSQSLHSIMSSDSTHNIRSFLDHLFHPDNDYMSKASARHLYEKVVIFCEQNSQPTTLWNTYIIKSLVQFFLWIVIFNINLILFVILEFYIMCPEDKEEACDHDTFLRIIWFMGQTVLLIYALFNCKTLIWINEKSIVKRNLCCLCRCFTNYRYANTQGENRLTCKPYRFADNLPVYNDAALMLHLLEEAHPKCIPPFVVFMFPEWKEKLTSFATPVLSSDTSSISAIQMISGKPSTTVSVVDVPMPTEKQCERKRTPLNKKKHQVTFSIESDDQNERELPSAKIVDNWPAVDSRSEASASQQLVKECLGNNEVEVHCDTSNLLSNTSDEGDVSQEASNHESDASETGLLIRE